MFCRNIVKKKKLILRFAGNYFVMPRVTWFDWEQKTNILNIRDDGTINIDRNVLFNFFFLKL